MKTIKIKERRCSQCGAIQDQAKQLHGEKNAPTTGDISICKICGCICEIDNNMDLVPLTPRKLYLIMMHEPKIYTVIKAEQERIKKSW
jgi:hypothetical protein